MGKRNRKRESRPSGPKRRSSSLADHRREKKVLTPPFLQLPNLHQLSWPQDGLPDFLWIQAVRANVGDLALVHEPLDLLDSFVPETAVAESAAAGSVDNERKPHPNTYLDGRISTFALVPETSRGPARNALREALPWALPDPLGHGLALYPQCPAKWLYDDWAAENVPDPDIGLEYLKGLVESLLDPRGRTSTQARMIQSARGFKHGKIFLSRDVSVVELLPKYPGGLNEDDRLHVESWARNMSNMLTMTSDREIASSWAFHFWRHSWQISGCEPESTLKGVGSEEERDDEFLVTGQGRALPTVADLQREFVAAIDVLGAGLREAQFETEIDLYEPVADEVKLGLASRVYRLLRRLASDPELWTNDMAPHVLRSLVDARILIAWLLKRDDQQLYRKFKEYGLGKRKLFKLQLEELMDREGVDADTEDEHLHDRLEAEVNQDMMEEFIRIDVGGNFAGRSIRQMARDVELGYLYSLTYQPLSTEAHGEWGSLIAFDLRHCGNPLHRYHRLGTFDTSAEEVVHLGWVRHAFAIASDAVAEVFMSYGYDVDSLFRQCLARLDKARVGTLGET